MNNEWVFVGALVGALGGVAIAVAASHAQEWLASRKAKKAGKV